MRDEKKTKRQLIKELNESRQQLKEMTFYRDIIEQLPVCTIFYDKSEKVIYRNKSSELIDGYGKKQLLGLSREEYLAKLEIKPGETVNILKPKIQTGEFGEGIFGLTKTTLKTKDGIPKNVLLTGSFIYGDAGDFLGACGCAIDMSEYEYVRSKMEEALRQQLHFFQKLIDTIPNPIFFKDVNGLFQGCNKAYEEFIGLKKEDLINRTVYDVYPQDLANKYREMDLSLFRQPGIQVYESPFLCADGKRHDIIFNKATYLNPKGEVAGLVGVIVDITERKIMEESLRKSEELFSRVIQSIPNPVAITTMEGIFIDVNKSFLNASGYTREEVINLAVSDLNIWINKEDCIKLGKLLYQKGTISNLDFSFRTKSGEIRDGLYSTELIDYRDGKYLLSVFIDITEKKQLEKEFVRLDRLNIVGQMAAGIGHEVRNPMTAVRGFLQVLKNKNECMLYRDYFELMINEIDRANSIITEFLSITRDKPLDLTKQKLNHVIYELTPLINANVLNSNHNVLFAVDDVPAILLSEKEIRQLILNLVNNGIESMEPGGTLTIKIFNDNGDIVLLVKDQGKGIPSNILDKIGTPFLTNKENGTGLGLAVCFSIATRHSATIDIETGSAGTSLFVRFKT